MRRQIPQFKVEIKRSRRPMRTGNGIEPEGNTIDPIYDDELPVRDIREDISYDQLRSAEEALFGRSFQPQNVTMSNDTSKSDDLEIPSFLRRTATPSPQPEAVTASVEPQVAPEPKPEAAQEKKVLPSLLGTDPVEERLSEANKRSKRGPKKVDTLEGNEPASVPQQKKLFDVLEDNSQPTLFVDAPVETKSREVEEAKVEEAEVEEAPAPVAEKTEDVVEAAPDVVAEAPTEEPAPVAETEAPAVDETAPVVVAEPAAEEHAPVVEEPVVQEETPVETASPEEPAHASSEAETADVAPEPAPITDDEWEEAAPKDEAAAPKAAAPKTRKPRQPRKQTAPKVAVQQPVQTPAPAPAPTPAPVASTPAQTEPAGEFSGVRPPKRLLYNRWASRELAKVAKFAEKEHAGFLKPGERWKRRLPATLW